MIYFDSAYVAKFYLTEVDSPRVNSLAEDEGRIGCSIIGQAEVAQVFHRKFREGHIARFDARALFSQFEADCAAGLWVWLPLTEGLIAETLNAFRRLPHSASLRTVDAIHLVTAKQHGIRTLYTNDRRMLDAAKYFKLRTKSV